MLCCRFRTLTYARTYMHAQHTQFLRSNRRKDLQLGALLFLPSQTSRRKRLSTLQQWQQQQQRGREKKKERDNDLMAQDNIVPFNVYFVSDSDGVSRKKKKLSCALDLFFIIICVFLVLRCVVVVGVGACCSSAASHDTPVLAFQDMDDVVSS